MSLAILAVSILLNILFGGYVFAQNKKNATNVIFFILSFVISIWLGIFYLSLVPFFSAMNLIFVRLSLLFAVIMTMFFYFLAWVVPQEKFAMNKMHLVLIVCGTCIANKQALPSGGYVLAVDDALGRHPRVDFGL